MLKITVHPRFALTNEAYTDLENGKVYPQDIGLKFWFKPNFAPPKSSFKCLWLTQVNSDCLWLTLMVSD